MFYLKISFIDLSLMANNSNCKTQTEDWNFSAFIKKIFRYKKKDKRRDDSNWSMGYLETNIHCICMVNLKSQALRFYWIYYRQYGQRDSKQSSFCSKIKILYKRNNLFIYQSHTHPPRFIVSSKLNVKLFLL